MIHELSAAGSSTKPSDRTDDDVLAREDLFRHLRYWLAVRRVSAQDSDVHSAARLATHLEPYDPVEMNDLAGSELVRRATDLGAYMVKIIDDAIEGGEYRWFAADACEIHRTRISDVSAEDFSLQETLARGSSLVGLRAARFTGRASSFFDGKLSVRTVPGSRAAEQSVDLSFTKFAAMNILVEAADAVVKFDDAVLASGETPCELSVTARSASFVHANLAGVRFKKCEFGSLDLTDANILGARFEECFVGGQPLGLVHLAQASDYDDAKGSVAIGG